MARSRERGTGSVYLPEDPKNPGQKLQTYWISQLRAAADTLDPLMFVRLNSMTAGPFAISVGTPLSLTLASITAGKYASRDRRKRESKASVPEGNRYSNPSEIRDWEAYVGDERVPVVWLKVAPLFGETGGSSFRRGLLTALVGVSGKATVRFQGDVRNVVLRRDGEIVEPLGGGHGPMPVMIENDLLDFNDVADFGYYLYPPETFRPDGPQRPPEITVEIEDLKHPRAVQRERLLPSVTARLWNDFEGYFRLVKPTEQFSIYELTKTCAVSSGASAMRGVSEETAGGGVCEYVVAPPSVVKSGQSRSRESIPEARRATPVASTVRDENVAPRSVETEEALSPSGADTEVQSSTATGATRLPPGTKWIGSISQKIYYSATCAAAAALAEADKLYYATEETPKRAGFKRSVVCRSSATSDLGPSPARTNQVAAVDEASPSDESATRGNPPVLATREASPTVAASPPDTSATSRPPVPGSNTKPRETSPGLGLRTNAELRRDTSFDLAAGDSERLGVVESFRESGPDTLTVQLTDSAFTANGTDRILSHLYSAYLATASYDTQAILLLLHGSRMVGEYTNAGLTKGPWE